MEGENASQVGGDDGLVERLFLVLLLPRYVHLDGRGDRGVTPPVTKRRSTVNFGCLGPSLGYARENGRLFAEGTSKKFVSPRAKGYFSAKPFGVMTSLAA